MSIIGLLSSLVRGEKRRALSSGRRGAVCRRSLRLEALETRRLFNVDSTTLACEPVDDVATLAEPDAVLIASVTGEELLVCEPATAQATTADLGTQESLVDDSTIDALVETDLTLTSVAQTTATDTSLYGPVSATSLSGTMVTGLFGSSLPAPVLYDVRVSAVWNSTSGLSRDGSNTPSCQSVTVVLGGVWEDSISYVPTAHSLSTKRCHRAHHSQRSTLEALAMGRPQA